MLRVLSTERYVRIVSSKVVGDEGGQKPQRQLEACSQEACARIDGD